VFEERMRKMELKKAEKAKAEHAEYEEIKARLLAEEEELVVTGGKGKKVRLLTEKEKEVSKDI